MTMEMIFHAKGLEFVKWSLNALRQLRMISELSDFGLNQVSSIACQKITSL